MFFPYILILRRISSFCFFGTKEFLFSLPDIFCKWINFCRDRQLLEVLKLDRLKDQFFFFWFRIANWCSHR